MIHQSLRKYDSVAACVTLLRSWPSRNWLSPSCVLLCCWVMAACGWQLRAGVRLPPEVMPVEIIAVDAYSDFYRELRRSLTEAGATLVQGNEAAGAKVRIRGDVTGDSLLSVSSRNTPEEYQVFYNIEYAIEFAGHEAVPMQPLGLTATYSYDSHAVVAKQRERAGVQQALARELARQVLQRLASLKSASG